MPGKIVIITVPVDQADILRDFLDWHLALGVDLIVAIDGGSTDASTDILDEYAKTGRVVWQPLPDRDLNKFALADELMRLARDRYGADWIILCDVDEFICTTGDDFRAVLAESEASGVAQLKLPRRTMTGPPLRPGQRATQALTLRIDRTVEATRDQYLSGDLPVPFVFIEVGPHLVVRASAIDAYGPGAHVATMMWGRSETNEKLYILHYAIRAFESLQKKVENTKAWLAVNQQLPPLWGWHWRRWIRLNDAGRLREDYDAQFVSAERAQQLIREGTCVVDQSVADWIEEKEARSRPSQRLSQWMQWMTKTLLPARTVSSR
jgi:hypothetical protein